jgi:hypothetical protein
LVFHPNRGRITVNRPLAVATLVFLAACTASTEETTTTTTTTTLPPTTTTTLDPGVQASNTCDSLKIATFDLERGVTQAFTSLGLQDVEELSDAEAGRIIVGSLVDFYDRVRVLAGSAPDAIAEDLDTVASSVDPWREALTEDDESLADTLEELEPWTLRNPELDGALERLAEWSERECGATIAFDAEEILFTTVFSAMFGALGDAFSEFGDAFGDGFDSGFDTSALAYGDDPGLDDLYDRCGGGDGAACSDLYYTSFGEYELWGQTCGATIPLRPGYLVDCESKFGSTASSYGDDFVFDTLWDECASGLLGSCDGLFAAAPVGSAYENYGATCGDIRQPGDIMRPCAFVASGEAFSYGEDTEFDSLWDGCVQGDEAACSDLFFSTPFDSAYEALGRTCGDLVESGRECTNVARWLGAPSA